MNIKRFTKKTIYHILKHIIRILNILDSRIAMFWYNRLLLMMGVKLNGTPRFISTDIRIDTFELIELGDRTVISERVTLLTHDYSITTALISQGENPSTDYSIQKKIIIGNNVFVGYGSILLPGTKVGNNVIIGAGTIVRGQIPDNKVVIGNPGIVITSINEYAIKCKKDSVSNYNSFYKDLK